MSFAHPWACLYILDTEVPLHTSRVADVCILRISTVAEALQSDRKLLLLGHKLFKGFVGRRQWKQLGMVDSLQLDALQTRP
jgi:hypothetical protein